MLAEMDAGRNLTFSKTNLIPSPGGIAVLMTVLRNYKGELQCTEGMYRQDVLKVSFLLPHVLISLCFPAYLRLG